MPHLRTLTTISALASLPRSHRTHAVESRKKMDIEGAPTPPSTRLGGAAFAPGAWPPFHTSNQRPSQRGPHIVACPTPGSVVRLPMGGGIPDFFNNATPHRPDAGGAASASGATASPQVWLSSAARLLSSVRDTEQPE